MPLPSTPRLIRRPATSAKLRMGAQRLDVLDRAGRSAREAANLVPLAFRVDELADRVAGRQIDPAVSRGRDRDHAFVLASGRLEPGQNHRQRGHPH
jgi:hypothetical protein